MSTSQLSSRWRDSNPRCFIFRFTRAVLSPLSHIGIILSTWRDLNPRDWVCNPAPSVFLLHSTTGAYVVGIAGFEPVTFSVSAWRSNQMSYIPILYPEVGSNHCHLHVKEIRYHYAIGAIC
jgi:hypothetical protein